MCVGGIRRDDKAGNNPVWKVHQSRACKKETLIAKQCKSLPLFHFLTSFLPASNFNGLQIVPECTGQSWGASK